MTWLIDNMRYIHKYSLWTSTVGQYTGCKATRLPRLGETVWLVRLTDNMRYIHKYSLWSSTVGKYTGCKAIRLPRLGESLYDAMHMCVLSKCMFVDTVYMNVIRMDSEYDTCIHVCWWDWFWIWIHTYMFVRLIQNMNTYIMFVHTIYIYMNVMRIDSAYWIWIHAYMYVGEIDSEYEYSI